VTFDADLVMSGIQIGFHKRASVGVSWTEELSPAHRVAIKLNGFPA
jgi:hypothetical protein